MRAAWKRNIPLILDTFTREHQRPWLEIWVQEISGNFDVQPISEAEYSFLMTIVKKEAKRAGLTVTRFGDRFIDVQ